MAKIVTGAHQAGSRTGEQYASKLQTNSKAIDAKVDRLFFYTMEVPCTQITHLRRATLRGRARSITRSTQKRFTLQSYMRTSTLPHCVIARRETPCSIVVRPRIRSPQPHGLTTSTRTPADVRTRNTNNKKNLREVTEGVRGGEAQCLYEAAPQHICCGGAAGFAWQPSVARSSHAGTRQVTQAPWPRAHPTDTGRFGGTRRT